MNTNRQPRHKYTTLVCLCTALAIASILLLNQVIRSDHLVSAQPLIVGTTITVNSTLDVIDANDGKCTLREAVIAANSDTASGVTAGECPAGAGADIIVLPAAPFLLTIAPAGSDDATTGDLNITSTMTIIGAGEASTIIDASTIHDRVFDVTANQFTLSQVRIQRGRAVGDGGGIYLEGSAAQYSLSHLSVLSSTATTTGGGIWNDGALTMTDVLLSNNSAIFGGGYEGSAGATFNHVTISNNRSSGDGGGIEQVGGATLALNNVSISNNQTNETGAGIDFEGALSATNSVFSGNVISSTFGWGGAIYARTGFTLTLDTVAVMSNSAAFGGGLYLDTKTTARLDNVTLNANTAITSGGAIYNAGALALTNVTISSNRAGPCAGGLFVPGAGSAILHYTGTLTLINATLAQNCAGNLLNLGGTMHVVSGSVQTKNSIIQASGSGTTCIGTVTSLGHNLDSANTCSFHQTGDLHGVNPLLAPLAGNGGPSVGAGQDTLLTHALLAGSPAIDAADNVDCPAFDERGDRRPADGNRDGLAACDMGAYEFWLSTFLPLILK